MDPNNPYNFKPGLNPNFQQNVTTRPSPTTSSPHSATHPSPSVLANFARTLNNHPANFEKMMSTIGFQQQRSEMGFGGDTSFAYGGQQKVVQNNSNHAGPSRSARGNNDDGPSESRVTSAGTAAKRGSKACVACECGCIYNVLI